MSRRKQLPTTHRLANGPDFANSSRFHSAPFQRQPVNRSPGPRFHSTPFHRLKSSKTRRRGKHGSAGRCSGYRAYKGVAAVARAKDSPQVQNFLT